MHHGELRLSVVLLLHEGYQVLSDHAAVDEELPLRLLFLGLFQELSCLVAYCLVLGHERLQSLLIFLGLLFLVFVVILKSLVVLEVVFVDFYLFLQALDLLGMVALVLLPRLLQVLQLLVLGRHRPLQSHQAPL